MRIFYSLILLSTRQLVVAENATLQELRVSAEILRKELPGRLNNAPGPGIRSLRNNGHLTDPSDRQAASSNGPSLL